MQLRRLGRGDEELFRAMNALFADVFEDHDSYGAAPPSNAYVEARLADPTFVAVIALDGGEIIGALAAYELRKFERERSELYIYDLAVRQGRRRQGVATALIDEVRRHARDIGAWTVYVQADPPDAPAVALYTKLGRPEHVLHFDITP